MEYQFCNFDNCHPYWYTVDALGRGTYFITNTKHSRLLRLAASKFASDIKRITMALTHYAYSV